MEKQLVQKVENYLKIKGYEIEIVKETYENFKGYLFQKKEDFKIDVVIPKILQHYRIQSYCDLLIQNYRMVKKYECK